MNDSYSDEEGRYYQEQDVGFEPCEICETPEVCAKVGCMKEKLQGRFMGDKYADRKKGM